MSASLYRNGDFEAALELERRHSQAPHFDVHLRGTGDGIDLTVRDDGVGFDVSGANRGVGLGLTSMKERLKLVGGELFIESQSTRGTTVLARAPVRRSYGRGKRADADCLGPR